MKSIYNQKSKDEVHPARNRWQPLSVPKAEALWERLEAEKTECFKRAPEDLAGIADLWFIGESGNATVAIVLGKDRRIGFTTATLGPRNIRLLPSISRSAGPYSLVNSLANICEFTGNQILCPPTAIPLIPPQLQKLFIHLATRPAPKASPLEHYESGRETLTVKKAESIAENAFRVASKAVNPPHKSEFADQWAGAALTFVMGGAQMSTY